ncbi:hypothetical protein B0H13DRAFT_1855047 [Mycena leptocephala]|nr:hypothetical protein B0H13DRAFT_1855047 [Mycena leptocephala]
MFPSRDSPADNKYADFGAASWHHRINTILAPITAAIDNCNHHLAFWSKKYIQAECGHKGDKGETHPRLSIQDLEKNATQFFLFILSYLILQRRRPEEIDIEEIKTEAQDEAQGEVEGGVRISAEKIGDIIRDVVATSASDGSALSFRDLAGIHGLPYNVPVPSANKTLNTTKNDPKDMRPSPPRWGGYCNHGSVLFPAWHPYVLAMEQAIGSVAKRVARLMDKKFPLESKGLWAKAAMELRFPWYDWAADEVKNDLPAVLYKDQITLKVRDKVRIKIDNPIAYYSFGSTLPDGFRNVPRGKKTPENAGAQDTRTSWFGDWNRTYRHVKGKTAPETKPDDEALKKTLKDNFANIQGRVLEYPSQVLQWRSAKFAMFGVVGAYEEVMVSILASLQRKSSEPTRPEESDRGTPAPVQTTMKDKRLGLLVHRSRYMVRAYGDDDCADTRTGGHPASTGRCGNQARGQLEGKGRRMAGHVTHFPALVQYFGCDEVIPSKPRLQL